VQSHLAAFERRGWCARDGQVQSQFDPGAETRRLVRTPNDGVLVQNQLIAPGNRGFRQPVGRAWNGLFRPTVFSIRTICAPSWQTPSHGASLPFDRECSANKRIKARVF
jgi:hypothetical protein